MRAQLGMQCLRLLVPLVPSLPKLTRPSPSFAFRHHTGPLIERAQRAGRSRLEPLRVAREERRPTDVAEVEVELDDALET